ncbi:hypothetical protein WJX81_002894 [Elliptochloris bilobata]|uniref:Apple domain-containing protein n=1 Tax=Elliptochloris bilobata TaxID=381761 RepID=A0AAW1RTH5_9CHLO
MLAASQPLESGFQVASTLSEVSGGLPSSADTSGSVLDSAAFRFAHPLRQFPGLVFKGNGECSPHSTYDYLSVRTVLVPTLEREAPAIRAYKQAPDSGHPSSVTYFDLPTGIIVQATLALNWTEQTPRFAYATLQPNVVDQAPYAAALANLTAVAQGLASGRVAYGGGATTTSCNGPLPALNDTVQYLQYAGAQLPNATAASDGLRPTELRAPSGCIAEPSADYKGDAVGEAVQNVRTYDACCQLCRGRANCNVFVWCPLTSGCASAGNTTALFLSCQLKRQAGIGSQPGAQPDAFQRGPPASFVSGRTIAAA